MTDHKLPTQEHAPNEARRVLDMAEGAGMSDFDDHIACIGVPCECRCPPTDAQQIDARIAAAEAEVARLRAKRVSP